MRSLGVDMDDKDNVSAWRWSWGTDGSALGHQLFEIRGWQSWLQKRGALGARVEAQRGGAD